MKREFKQLIVVFALVIALVAVGCLVSGCGKKQPDPTQTTTDPVWTIPSTGDSTSSSETTKSSAQTSKYQHPNLNTLSRRRRDGS